MGVLNLLILGTNVSELGMNPVLLEHGSGCLVQQSQLCSRTPATQVAKGPFTSVDHGSHGIPWF